jgi:competence protein ComEA
MNRHYHRALVQSLIVTLLPLAGALAGPVNLNSADAKTLAKELDGIGPAKAQAIVEYRQKNGPFHAAEDLLKVEGIGPKVLEQNRGNIRLEKTGGAAAAPQKPASKAAAKQSGG